MMQNEMKQSRRGLLIGHSSKIDNVREVYFSNPNMIGIRTHILMLSLFDKHFMLNWH